MESRRENFGGRLAVVMAMAGSAIGLGNLWRFPYLVGEHGGSVVMHLLFMGATVLIVAGGVKSGIEKFSKFIMPLLFVMIIVIAVYSVTLPGASEGVRYLVEPDFSAFTPRTAAYAMG